MVHCTDPEEVTASFVLDQEVAEVVAQSSSTEELAAK
jgi:hypothetical protein